MRVGLTSVNTIESGYYYANQQRSIVVKRNSKDWGRIMPMIPKNSRQLAFVLTWTGAASLNLISTIYD